MFNKRLFLGILGISYLAISNCFAGFYYKGFVGNIDTNMLSEFEYESAPAPFNNFTGSQDLTSKKSITYGAGIGYDIQNDTYSRLSYGIDLNIQQFGDQEYITQHGPGASGFTSSYNIETKHKNSFKSSILAQMRINKAFYFKAGPSVLRQEIEQRIYETTPTPISKVKAKTDREYIFGGTFGAGFIYKVSKTFGFYTEYNYSIYPSKSLSSVSIPEAAFPNGLNGTGAFNQKNRELEINQGEFYFGLIWM